MFAGIAMMVVGAVVFFIGVVAMFSSAGNDEEVTENAAIGMLMFMVVGAVLLVFGGLVIDSNIESAREMKLEMIKSERKIGE